MPTPIEVKPLDNYRIWIRYSDGVEGIVDLSEFAGKGVFALWDDYREFQKVHIGSAGEIAWSDQVDVCPDAIYLRLTGKEPEDIFPRREREREHGWRYPLRGKPICYVDPFKGVAEDDWDVLQTTGG